eukprot:1282458-Rhodomonas_salina.1
MAAARRRLSGLSTRERRARRERGKATRQAVLHDARSSARHSHSTLTLEAKGKGKVGKGLRGKTRK